MTARDEIFRTLRNLSLDREAVALMREDIAGIEEDEKQKELPAVQRAALKKERLKLTACMNATANHISRVERLLAQLSPEEQKVLEYTIVYPRPEAVFDVLLVCCRSHSLLCLRGILLTDSLRRYDPHPRAVSEYPAVESGTDADRYLDIKPVLRASSDLHILPESLPDHIREFVRTLESHFRLRSGLHIKHAV